MCSLHTERTKCAYTILVLQRQESILSWETKRSWKIRVKIHITD
jgi:hypothetical protein